MTDSEIVKALECCVCADGVSSCGDCPRLDASFGANTAQCTEGLIGDALDLINRQQAEIERLNKEVDRLSQLVLYHDGDVVDAVKEFAEAVDKLKYPNAHELRGFVIYCDDFDNLVKERLGNL